MAENGNSCDVHYDLHLETVNILRTTTAAVSTAFCLLAIVVAVITYCRRSGWNTQSNRLILSFLVAALFYSFATVFQWIRIRLRYDDTEHKHPKWPCQLVGFLVEHFSWTLILMTVFLIYYLFSVVYKNKLKAIVYSKLKNHRIACSLLGAFCGGEGKIQQRSQLVFAIVVSFFGPLLFTWIPFVPRIKAYGLSGYWCWIEICDKNGDRYVAGYILQGVLWYGPIFLVAIFIVVLIVLVVYGLCKRNKEEENKVAFPLLVYPILFLILNIFAFVNRLAVAIVGRPLYVLAILHSLIDPLWGTIASLTFFLYMGTVCFTQYRESRKQNVESQVHLQLDDYDELDS